MVLRLITRSRSDGHCVVSSLLVAAISLAVLAACGSGDDATGAGTAADSHAADRPTIVVTTSILGDVVTELVGDQATVVTIMPVGVDPHDFQASAQEVDQLLAADALVTNGAGFEEGLVDVIASARSEGVPTFESVESVETIEFGASADGEHDDEDGEDSDEEGEHSDEEEHGDHEGADPHFFTDPVRMGEAVEGLAAFLGAEVEGLDADAMAAEVERYGGELEALDAEIEELVEAIPADERVLVTNHEVFAYFADRYGFEIVGTVIPGGSTTESVSAGELAELADVIEAEGVPAIFADASSADQLVDTLAAEVGDIEVVGLYSESLGEPGSDGGTYLAMIRTNATRISAALS